MAACSHPFSDPGRSCPHAVVGESGLCLWHNAAVRKGDVYVRDLLLQADVLAKGDLAGFQLAGLVWPGAALPMRNLRGADLRDAVLDGAELDGCDLSAANLRRASLKRCDLRGVRLVGADLTGVNLCDADLRDADLSGAVVDGSLLMGADLTGANLAGAQVHSFRWNRRTRFAGVKGFEARPDGGTDAPTQAFLAPLATETRGISMSTLSDGDPEDQRTREFCAVAEAQDDTPAEPLLATAPTRLSIAPAPVPAARPRWPLAVAASLAVVGLSVGVWGWQAGNTSAAPEAMRWTALERERDNLLRQHEADLAEMRRIQDRERTTELRTTAQQQELAQRRSELEATRSSLREALLDAGRRQSAEDRAAMLGLTVQELESINGELARHGARQERLGRVLADGVVRLDQERGEAVLALERNRTDAQRLAVLEQEARRLGVQLHETGRDRDALMERNRILAHDLQAAQQDIERYLARIEGTQLQETLTGAGGDLPLLPVVPGSPIALNGAYLLTLRVDPGPQTGSVQTQVVVQRPPSAANPEVTVMLFDADRQPLRRLAYSFPHVDRGAPLVTSTTITACDRFPAFARVQVVPGLDGMTAARH